jgi:hypothetical protein
MRPASDIKAINRLNFFFIELNLHSLLLGVFPGLETELGDWVSRDADTTLGNAAQTALPITCQVKRYFA